MAVVSRSAGSIPVADIKESFELCHRALHASPLSIAMLPSKSVSYSLLEALNVSRENN